MLKYGCCCLSRVAEMYSRSNVVNTSKINLTDFLEGLNSFFPSLKFTMELEKDGKIPFLDLWVIRNGDHCEFDIYRKETNNNQFIHASSNHHFKHKLAAFESGVHRLLSVPLNNDNFSREKLLLQRIAVSNGFKPEIVDRLIKKRLNKISLKDFTTLTPILNPPKRIAIPFNKFLCRNLDNIFRKQNLSLAYKNIRSLKSILGSPKDVIDTELKSGIYKINCDCDPNRFYIGQTKRNIFTRFKEHIGDFTNTRIGRSAVADHMIDEGHDPDSLDLNLVKNVNDDRLLNPWESLIISINSRNTKMLNCDQGPMVSSLFNLYKEITYDKYEF